MPTDIEHFDLSGRRAVVVGADTPAGAAITEAFREAGATVVAASDVGGADDAATAVERARDELGGLDEAVAFAAELVDIPEGEYGRKSITTELSPTEQMIVDMLGTAKSFGLQFDFLRPEPSSLQRLAGRLEEALAPLTQFDDPKGVYAHCLCAFE